MTRERARFGALAAVQGIKRRKRVRVERSGAVATTYDIELRLWDKVAALLLLGKHLGLFGNRGPGPNADPSETVNRIERVIVDAKLDTLAVAPNTEGASPAREARTLEQVKEPHDAREILLERK